MQFGYFTLSDNHYLDNRRGANQLISGILALAGQLNRCDN
jgi:hypothetical protein